jgi:hypothetical protein
MTDEAKTSKFLIEQAITNNKTPYFVANSVIFDHYYKMFSYNNCLFIVSTYPNLAQPALSDYACYIVSYDFINAVLYNDETSVTMPTSLPVNTGESMASIKTYLRKLQAANYAGYEIQIDNDVYITDIIGADFSNEFGFKIARRWAETYNIPPTISTKYMYGTYENIVDIIIPMHDIPVLFASSDPEASGVPLELYNMAVYIRNKNITPTSTIIK